MSDIELPCYICADPSKDTSCSTSVCATCGEKLRVKNQELHAQVAELQAERDEARAEVAWLGVAGKGRWCPSCKAWLLGLQSPGTSCGTCHAAVEWRSLMDLMGEYHATLAPKEPTT
jgi:uncharacterized Zn finger protein (UPF0148 family)